MRDSNVSTAPLDGAVVLDLADEPMIIAGRYLADLGARVIRIESAGGDYIRRTGPWLDGEPGNERALRHLLYNQGKESLALDLTDPAAWELIEQMSDSADVVIAPMEQPAVSRDFFARSLTLVTFMPSLGLRMHEAARTRSPSISTMQARQLPSAR